MDASGNLYVAAAGLGETASPAVYLLNPATPATILTVATGYPYGGSTWQLVDPAGLAVDAMNNVFVADLATDVIVQCSPGSTADTWTATLVAGQPYAPGYADDTPGAQASFNSPTALALDPTYGLILVADSGNNVIRAISRTSPFPVSTVVGTAGLYGTLPGLLPATLYDPIGVAYNPRTGNLVITVPDAVLQTQ
jgi:hypothetical protein